MIEPVEFTARPEGWFAVEGGAAAAAAAFVAGQVSLLVAAGDDLQHSWGAASMSSLAIALGAGLWALFVGLVARAVLTRLAVWERSVQERGFAVLHVVAIGTAVPWIVLSLVLGSWQATTITIVVAVLSGAAAGWFAARHIWEDEHRQALAR